MIGVGQEFPYFVKNGVDYVNAMCEVAYDDFNGWKVYYFYPKISHLFAQQKSKAWICLAQRLL